VGKHSRVLLEAAYQLGYEKKRIRFQNIQKSEEAMVSARIFPGSEKGTGRRSSLEKLRRWQTVGCRKKTEEEDEVQERGLRLFYGY
jgi:hypothetical protein